MFVTKEEAEEKRRLLSEAAVVIVAAAAAVAPHPLHLPKLGRSREATKVKVKKRIPHTTNLSTSNRHGAFASSKLYKLNN